MGGGPFSYLYHCSASTSLVIVFIVFPFDILAHFIHFKWRLAKILSDLKVQRTSRGGGALF